MIAFQQTMQKYAAPGFWVTLRPDGSEAYLVGSGNQLRGMVIHYIVRDCPTVAIIHFLSTMYPGHYDVFAGFGGHHD
jgi:hypothetical protein